MLVAPASVTRGFDELTRAWDVLAWNLRESGPVGRDGDRTIWFVSEDDKDVIRVRAVLKQLKQLKSAMRPAGLGALEKD